MIRFGAPQGDLSETKPTEVTAAVQLKFVVCPASGQTLAPNRGIEICLSLFLMRYSPRRSQP